MNLKSIESKAVDINEKDNVIQVYVSAFDIKDSDGDVITKGAYTKTVSEWGPLKSNRIWFLKNHNTEHDIAKPFEIIQDNYGLKFSVKMPNTTKAKDLYEMYKEGHITEHSVGFSTVKQQAKSDYNEITEIKLYEGSAVLWGANEFAKTVSVKSMEEAKTELQKLNEEFARTIKSLRNWKGTEEGYELLEIKLTQLQDLTIKHIEAVTQLQPAMPLHVDDNPHEIQVKQLLNIIETKLHNMNKSE